MNAAAKLFIALVIVAAGYCLASLFGPAQLSANISFRNAASGSGTDSAASGEDPALLFGHVRLTPDTTLREEEKPPSAVLKGTIVPSPDVESGASMGMPSPMPEPAPLWLNARAVAKLEPPVENPDQPQSFATFRDDWSAEENRNVSPAYFAEENPNRAPLVQEQLLPQREQTTSEFAELDDEERGLRTHVVIDGDSLARLAERYLDDTARWHEIFALNRDQIADPGLLSIGVELKLPPKSASGNEQFADAPGTIAQGMVKVDPATISANQPPEARLLQPQTAKPIYQQYHFTVAD